VRAKQDLLDLGGDAFSVLPILMHGDAAFAGQGVVAETLQMSQLRGYRTGGTIHVIVNNQVGFTTAPKSSPLVGLLHRCRPDDPGADLPRQRRRPRGLRPGRRARLRVPPEFHKDVVIDMVCYRRRGHNEGDDPSMTQPLMYNLIDSQALGPQALHRVADRPRRHLAVEDAEAALRDYQEQLERVFLETRERRPTAATTAYVDSTSVAGRGGLERPGAGGRPVDRDGARRGRHPHHRRRCTTRRTASPSTPSSRRQLQRRRAAMVREGGIDWGMGELLALGSLLMEGTPVRLAGQDSRRGTFVQRHAVLIDRSPTARSGLPLHHLRGTRQVLGLRLAAERVRGDGLRVRLLGGAARRARLWEAQFGDFANGAQTIVDEFISSSEQKWASVRASCCCCRTATRARARTTRSARIERFLQLCAMRTT
jgi:2-oxoglutarate dehydrogenase E1 component